MIAKNDPDLMQASDELYKVNKDDILRQQARARADAEFWEKVHNARMEKMQEELAQNKEQLSKSEQELLKTKEELVDREIRFQDELSKKDATISEKDNEIRRLKEQLAQKHNAGQ